MLPTSTFFNLPVEKKDRILEAALDEFAEYSYDESNISRIIKQAGIPRGSYYQYFEDKEDLYLYIISIIAQEKRKILLPTIQELQSKPFFDIYKSLFIKGMEFGQKYPRYAQIGQLFITRPNEELKEKLYGKGSDEADAVFGGLIKAAVARGEIREHVDSKLVSRILTTINTQVLQRYVEEWGGYDFDKLFQLIDEIIDIFQYGIKKQ